MADVFTNEERSRIMSVIRAKNTRPEMVVRSTLHRMGYRFLLHRKDLPGCPDIVLPRYRAIVQIHGCFWHQHYGCHRATMPKSNTDFWQQKLEANVKRDQRVAEELRARGWRVLVIWECETRDHEALVSRLRGFLEVH